MTDPSHAVENVVRAISDAGRSPAEHQRQIEHLALEWPTLARALADLLAEQQARVPQEWKRQRSGKVW